MNKPKAVMAAAHKLARLEGSRSALPPARAAKATVTVAGIENGLGHIASTPEEATAEMEAGLAPTPI
jgi:hypothetical protein